MIKLRNYAEQARQAAGNLNHVEWVPLAVLLVAALATWAFAELADEVVEGDVRKMDRSILMSMRNPEESSDPLGPRWFEEFVRDITAFGSLGVLGAITFASCGYLWLKGKRGAVVYVLVAVLGAQGLSSTLKMMFERPRPDLLPHGMQVYTASFPSGHSVMSTATFLTLGALLARYHREKTLRVYLVLVAMLLSVAVGVSRVYLSVHWPTDVVGGWTVGAAWALLCWGVAAYLQRRGVIERNV